METPREARRRISSSCLPDLEFQVRPLEEMERQLTNISTGMRELGRLVGDIFRTSQMR